jgi:hypothetical protein
MHKFGLRERRFSYTPSPVIVMDAPIGEMPQLQAIAVA